MAESKPSSDSSRENSPAPIDPDVAAEAVREVNEAMAILPRKRLGCLRRFAKIGLILFVLLVVFVYWNFGRTPALRISKGTTYLTEPLTADGTRVDYFAALERELYSPETRTDENGYRLIVKALGDVSVDEQAEEHTVQVYTKLGLDPAIKPTMSFVETYEFFQKYCKAEGLDEKQVNELDAKVYRPWTLDELPMLGPWLEKNGPVLDLVGEAVRKPVFRIPLVRVDEGKTLNETLTLSEWQRTRSFARMLSARAYYRIGTGDIDGAIDDVIASNRLGSHVEVQGTVIARLVGIAIRGIAGSIGVAGNREVQPTEEQFQRLVDEINALPPRAAMERVLQTERYHALDSLQAMAMGDESLGDVFAFADWQPISGFESAVVDHLSVDWNIVMTEINARFDALENGVELPPPAPLSPRDLITGLFRSSRSRRVADLMEVLCIPSMAAAREANRRSICGDNLRRITLAMLLYEHEHGTLPPAYTVDAGGKPLHSWRVILLPYLGEEELYAKLRLDEPWDSEHNRRFHETSLGVYQCPSAELRLGQTNYSVIVGKNAAFQGVEGKPSADFGVNLMLVVEREQPVCWMDPASELVEGIAVEGINCREPGVHGIGAMHPGGTNAGFRSGGVRFVTETVERFVLQGLLDGTAEVLP